MIHNTHTCKCGAPMDYRARRCWKCTLVKFTHDQLKECVRDSHSFLEVAGKLGSSRTSVTRVAKGLDLDISHFRPGRNRPIPVDQLLVNGSHRRISAKSVAISGAVPYKCIRCGNEGEWRGSKLTLELDHRDGNRYNNVLDNLRFLCPNCHSQQPTNKGRNKIRYLA